MLERIQLHRRADSKIAVTLFFATFLFVGLWVCEDYGISWDEPASRLNGLHSFNYVFEGNNALLTYEDRDYGVAFEMPLYIIEKALHLEDPRDIYLMRHLCTFLMFYAGVFFFYLLGKFHFGSWKIGLLGALFLVLSPRIFAHSFYNSKDLVLLSAFVIAAYTLFRFLAEKTLLRAALHALSCALLINTRIIGVLVPFLTFLSVGLEVLKPAVPEDRRRAIKSFSAYLVLLVPLTVLFWPFLWDDPLGKFIQVFENMSRFKWRGTVLYLGEYIKATELPWHYFPVWLIITTPLFYTFAFLAGLLSTAWSMGKNPPCFFRDSRRNDLLLLLWFFLPPLAVIVQQSVLYDSWRHLFFIYPAFLLLSLRGLSALSELCRAKLRGQVSRIAPSALILVALFSLLDTAHFMVQNHPHQNVFFNFLAGGDPAAVKDRFELDYWGLSYRQALEYILENDPGKEVAISVANHPGVYNALILPLAERSRLKYVTKSHEATYFLSNFRWHREGYPRGKEFYSIRVGGVKIMVVLQRP